jgi:hypothetical protein
VGMEYVSRVPRPPLDGLMRVRGSTGVRQSRATAADWASGRYLSGAARQMDEERTNMPDQRELPPALMAEARTKPGGWVYEIVGDYGPQDAVPPSAIRGAWKVNDEGEIVGDFLPNPNFKAQD